MIQDTQDRAVPRKAFPFPAPLLRQEGQHARALSVGTAAPWLGQGGTPGFGSFLAKLEAGNSSLVKCVVSEAGSY